MPAGQEEYNLVRVSQLKMPLSHTGEELFEKLRKKLRVEKGEILKYEIRKRSLDARKASEIHYTYAIDVTLRGEEAYLKKNRDRDITRSTTVEYIAPQPSGIPMPSRPVVCGSGPAGMFCAYFLARAGYKPIVIERGEEVGQRTATVERFFSGEALNTESNVQFGEGGAGTFSDGKLNTMVKDTYGRIRKVLEIFVEAGAPEEILYQNKPHIGTDNLRAVVAAMRGQIKEWGGEFHFNTKLSKIRCHKGKLVGISCVDTGKSVAPGEWEIATSHLVLAIGHSARDTLEMLSGAGLLMEAKAFAVGVRVEHEQDFINRVQYRAAAGGLPAADYKLTHTAKNGRGIYSFCMCPGGYVVNASSEEGHLVVNGMSNYDRAGRNANSALVVTVTPADFPCAMYGKNVPAALSGIYFQRHFEALAYRAAAGKIPCQLYGDFLCGRESSGFGRIIPCHKGAGACADLRKCLPDFAVLTLLEGMEAFDRMMPGFADEEAVFSGVEMRTSSPVRIPRDEQYKSNIDGIYPCGEGAGYAGGIMSAAVDGIKVFEAIASQFQA